MRVVRFFSSPSNPARECRGPHRQAIADLPWTLNVRYPVAAHARYSPLALMRHRKALMPAPAIAAATTDDRNERAPTRAPTCEASRHLGPARPPSQSSGRFHDSAAVVGVRSVIRRGFPLRALRSSIV